MILFRNHGFFGFCLLAGSSSGVASQQQQQQKPLLQAHNPVINDSPAAAHTSLDAFPASLGPVSASPSFSLSGQVPLLLGNLQNDYGNCAAIGAATIPGCARDCFTTGAAALGCHVWDLGCQCRQQARMMAAAEGCVADSCPKVVYQEVIDGAMAMCSCAVGVATAEVSAGLERPGQTVSISVLSGSFSVIPPSQTVVDIVASITQSGNVQVDTQSAVPILARRDMSDFGLSSPTPAAAVRVASAAAWSSTCQTLARTAVVRGLLILALVLIATIAWPI